MRAAVAFGIIALLAVSPALAQWQGGRSEGDRGGGESGYRSPEGAWRGTWHDGTSHDGTWHDDREAGENWGHRRERAGSDQPGPFIRLRANGVEITLRCGAEDAIRSCVDAASTLVDRAGALRATSRAGAGDATPDSQSISPRQP